MALKLGTAKTRKVRVEVQEPLDYGKTKLHKFDAELDIIPKSEWEELFKTDNKPTDTEILDMTLKNIDGLVDENDQALAFDDDIKAAVLDEPWLVAALIEHQIAIQAGKTSAEYKRMKLKNS